MDPTRELRLLVDSFDRNARVDREMRDALSLVDLDISHGRGGRTTGGRS